MHSLGLGPRRNQYSYISDSSKQLYHAHQDETRMRIPKIVSLKSYRRRDLIPEKGDLPHIPRCFMGNSAVDMQRSDTIKVS